jgi:hypothetical protein
MASRSLLVFGSQTSWPSVDFLSQLRSILLLEPSLHQFLATIKDLSKTWEALVAADARLQQVDGLDAINCIQGWIDTGDFGTTPEPLLNVLAAPMTIIIQMAHYLSFVTSKDTNTTQKAVLESAQDAGVQGLCTGLLSAIAVACSKTQEELGSYSSVALRIALCVGAYVDLDEILTTPASCIAIRWRTENGKEEILKMLKDFPGVRTLDSYEGSYANCLTGLYLSDHRSIEYHCYSTPRALS